MKQVPFWRDPHDGGGVRLPPSRKASADHRSLGEGRQAQHQPELPRRADVVVVGAGYTGLAAARELARRGASVVVVERAQVGAGASSRNGGQVLTGLQLDPAALVARAGEARAQALFAASLESIGELEQLIADERIACEYARTGHIQAASKRSHFEAFREEQALLARVFNHRVELVSAPDQQSEIGSPVYHGLLVDERSGALDPAKYVDAIAAAACRAGATILEDTPVVALTRRGSAWAVATPRGDIEAGEVLIATNGYTSGATPALQRRFVPIGSYIIATAPLSADHAAMLLPKGRMAFDSLYFLHYFRLTTDRRLLFGGRAEFGQPTPETTARCAAILRRDMVAIFPSLESVAIDYAWSGNVAFTRDRLPHAGLLGGLYFAGGYGGHGIAMATALGAAVARRIAGAPGGHPLISDRFPPIPLYRGRPWFLPIVGAYYRLRDWMS